MFKAARIEVDGRLWREIVNHDVGDATFLGLLDEMKELHLRKSADYGSDADPFANLRGAGDIGILPSVGCWLRAKDKVWRIDQHFRKQTLVNESVEDSLQDLAAYCLIAIVLLREEGK